MKEDSLNKRYIIKLFSNITLGVVGTILVAIVPKTLGPIAYGQFIYIQDFFMKIISFLDMGTSLAFFTKLSSDNKRKELIIFYFFYSLLVISLLLIFIFTIDIFGYTNTFLPDIPLEYIYMGVIYSFLNWLTQVFIKISDAYALTVSVEIIKIIHKIASLVLLLCLINFTIFKLDTYFYFLFVSFISFIAILVFLYIKKGIFLNIHKYKLSIQNVTKEFFNYCHPLLINSVIGLGVGFFNIWILQKYGGSIQTGFYGLAYSIAAMCFLFTSAMTPVITREFSKAYGENNLEKMRKLFYKYIPMLYSISAYFGIFISLQSDNVLTIFTDEKFKDANNVLMIMALYPIHQTYGQLSSSIFYATGATKLYRNISLFTQPIMVILSFIFIVNLNLGAVGLALSMLISQLISVNIGLYFNSKYLNLNLKYFLAHQIYSIVFFIILAYISSQILFFNSALFNFLVSGVIYTILVIIFVYIVPQVLATNRKEINILITRFKSVIKK